MQPTTTKERPMWCDGWEVRAIRGGRKTQLRRVIRFPLNSYHNDRLLGDWPLSELHSFDGETLDFEYQTDVDDSRRETKRCPFGVCGDLLWVKERFYQHDGHVTYHADCIADRVRELKWRPSIYMPRWASRITLKITGVRVERLNEISDEDAIAEGIHRFATNPPMFGSNPDGTLGPMVGASAVEAFAYLWESINGKGSWDANQWVWVIEFEQVKE